MSFQDNLKDLQDQFQSIDWSNIRPDNIGSWPLLVKALAWFFLLLAIIFGGYYAIIKELQETQGRVVLEEKKLKSEFQRKAIDASNLDAYRLQMDEMSDSFDAMISQLPSETEVPGLLEDITAKGVSSGLQFDSIELNSEQKKEFYIQLPISIKAIGTYHDMGRFVGGVASLPRIVTLSDFKIQVDAKTGQRDNSKLSLDVVAHTYRYNETTSKKKGR